MKWRDRIKPIWYAYRVWCPLPTSIRLTRAALWMLAYYDEHTSVGSLARLLCPVEPQRYFANAIATAVSLRGRRPELMRRRLRWRRNRRPKIPVDA